MPSVSCHCGARYKVGESSLGKKAKCKKCGKVFTLALPEDAGPLSLGEDDAFMDDAVAEAAEQSKAAPVEQDHSGSKPIAALALPPMGRTITSTAIVTDKPKMGAREYFRDLIATLTFFLKPASLISFIVMWVILVVGIFGAYVPFFGFVLLWMSWGWYAAFRFAVLRSAAAGEAEVPMVSLEDGVADGIVFPLLKWIGTWALALAPVMVFTVVYLGTAPSALAGGVTPIISSGGADVTLVSLCALGFFLWPMIVLCVSLEGFGSLLHVGLIGSTLLRTLPMYLLTVAIVMGTQYVDYAWRTANLVAGVRTNLYISIFGAGLTLYIEVLAMRAIGLYYFHFKRRFAWDSG